jgi:2-methylcitrate dehydratase
MIPAMLAMAEATGASGRDVVACVYIAYEIASRLAESVPPDTPWDQGLYCSLGVAGALSKMTGLSPEKTAHALSLVAVSAVPLRVTRFGELSQWKAAAAPYATMGGILAARLAAHGMTGPPEPFEGKNGLFEKVWPAFELDLTPRHDAASGIERSSLKKFGACYWAQVGIDIMDELRRDLVPSDVVAIEVYTCRTSWYVIGGGSGDAEQRWRPPTRETADHSLPFLMATMLVDGEIGEDSFDASRRTDAEFLSVVDRISVAERADLSERATRDSCPTEVRVRLSNGEVLSMTRDYPRGHPRSPMNDTDLIAKFRAFVSAALPTAEVDELQELLWNLPSLSDLNRLGELIRQFGMDKNSPPPAETIDTLATA